MAWHAGRLSEALEASVGCAQQACTQLVRGDCVRWNSELARSLPSLVLAVRDDSGNDVANARTFANGLLRAGVQAARVSVASRWHTLPAAQRAKPAA